MKECIVTFVRHGIAIGNLEKQHLGVTNDPLAQKGIDRLTQLAQEGGYPPVERVYASPLTRCLQTAGIVYPEHKPIVVDGFIERDFGAYEAKNFEGMKHDPAYMEWVNNGFKAAPPEGGEALADFAQRSVTTFRTVVDQLFEEGVHDAAFCIHGGVIMAIMASLILPERDMYDYLPGNGMGYTVRITEELWKDYKAECLAEVPNGNAKAKYRCEVKNND
jgi:alpha-ribazole phosphatase